MAILRIPVCATTSLLGTFLFILTGCGGGAGVGSYSNNPYAGKYAGVALVEQANMVPITIVTLDISRTGAVTGTSVTAGQSAPLSGAMSTSGDMSISDGGTFTGTFSSPLSTTISAILSPSGSGLALNMILIAKPTAGQTSAHPFAGDYAGTTLKFRQNVTGPIAFRVDTLGNLSGTMLIYDGLTPKMASIAGTVSTTGDVTISQTVSGVQVGTVTGTVSRLNGHGIGSASTSDGDQINWEFIIVA